MGPRADLDNSVKMEISFPCRLSNHDFSLFLLVVKPQYRLLLIHSFHKLSVHNLERQKSEVLAATFP